jgi:hypothetical protein
MTLLPKRNSSENSLFSIKVLRVLAIDLINISSDDLGLLKLISNDME